MGRFHLPKLRGRSVGRQRLVDDDDDGIIATSGGGHIGEPSNAKTAVEYRSVPPPPESSPTTTAVALEGGGAKLLQPPPSAQAGVSMPPLISPENQHHNVGTSYAMASSSPPPPSHHFSSSSPQRRRQRCDTAESNDQSAASSDYDDFTSAFNRSVPSFDNFNSDAVLGRRDYDSGSIFCSDQEGGILDNDNNVIIPADASFYSYEGNPISCDPSDCGDESFGADMTGGGDDNATDNDNNNVEKSPNTTSMTYSHDDSGSADPPAILMLDDDDEDEDKLIDGKQKNQNNLKSEWSFDAFANVPKWDDDDDDIHSPKNKNRRLVSPSPSPAKKGEEGGRKILMADDLVAWGGGGGAAVTESKSENNGGVFGNNNNFFNDDVDELFGNMNTDEDFSGSSWVDVEVKKQQQDNNASMDNESDPWKETSFSVDEASFNNNSDKALNNHEEGFGRWNSGGSNGHALFEEKKDDENPPQSSPTLVWDDRAADKNELASALHPLKKKSPTKQHPLKSSAPITKSSPKQQPQRKENHHRRLNSNDGSQSSRRSQLSKQSQQQKHHRPGIKSSGSIGSNSSAVDQILEHYRQKRRAKDKVGNGGRVTPSSLASTSFGSSKYILTPGSAGSSSGGVGNVGVIRSSSSGGCSHSASSARSHRRIPSGGSSSAVSNSRRHRRNPSSESVSRIIDNLETSARIAPVNSSSSGPAVVLEKYRNHQPTSSELSANIDQFLLSNIEATIGPHGVAPDVESLTGRGNRSQRQQKKQNHWATDTASVNSGRISRASRTSRNSSRHSFRTHQSTRSLSALTSKSRDTQSVANDLFRLEAQLAEQVTRQQREEDDGARGDNRSMTASSVVLVDRTPSLGQNVTYSTSGELSNGHPLGAEPVPRPTPFTVVAPPGKLGIILSNKSISRNTLNNASRGPLTHVSAIRSESVLAGKVQVGDAFLSIDDEDITSMTSREIMSIMSRKAEYERVLKFRPVEAIEGLGFC